MNKPDLKNITLLYVEDDPPSRKVVELIARKAMSLTNIYMFEDSNDFLDHLKALPRQPDLILLDIQINPIDGFEILRILRDHPDYRGVKVVAVTASVMNEEVERLRASGFDGAVGKPLSVLTFPQLMASIIEGHSIWYVP